MESQLAFDAIGTKWNISYQYPQNTVDPNKVKTAIMQRIDQFDKAYSRFRPDSLVTKMSKKPSTYPLPPDGYKMLELYRKLYIATNGKVTPMIGNVMEDAGYDAKYSLTPKTLTSPKSWDESLSYTKRTITLYQQAILDFGAAGKGYLIDIIGGLMQDEGVTEYTINAGGDIRHFSNSGKVIDIGLENPFDTSYAIGIIRLGQGSICASAGTRRTWASYHHIIDPQQLQSPQEVIATWVIADEALVADGLSTALFFADAATLKKQFSFSYALLRSDMSLEHDPALAIKLLSEAAK